VTRGLARVRLIDINCYHGFPAGDEELWRGGVRPPGRVDTEEDGLSLFRA
jgi:hypothetical protein